VTNAEVRQGSEKPQVWAKGLNYSRSLTGNAEEIKAGRTREGREEEGAADVKASAYRRKQKPRNIHMKDRNEQKIHKLIKE